MLIRPRWLCEKRTVGTCRQCMAEAVFGRSIIPSLKATLLLTTRLAWQLLEKCSPSESSLLCPSVSLCFSFFFVFFSLVNLFSAADTVLCRVRGGLCLPCLNINKTDYYSLRPFINIMRWFCFNWEPIGVDETLCTCGYNILQYFFLSWTEAPAYLF